MLAGAIDYYILDKWQRLRNPKAYTKVSCFLHMFPKRLAVALSPAWVKAAPNAGKPEDGEEAGDRRLWHSV